jgi:hypothetical protein
MGLTQNRTLEVARSIRVGSTKQNKGLTGRLERPGLFQGPELHPGCILELAAEPWPCSEDSRPSFPLGGQRGACTVRRSSSAGDGVRGSLPTSGRAQAATADPGVVLKSAR